MRSEVLSPGKDIASERETRVVSSSRIRESSSSSKKPRSRKRRNIVPDTESSGDETFSLIVHCHLCWDWVWQRPQQFISRISQKHRVLFVEMAGPDETLAVPTAHLSTLADFPNISVLRMQFPAWRWADGEYVDRERRRILEEVLQGPLAGEFDNFVQWFYDPMAFTAFGEGMGELAVVYDCMDELSKFKGAPPEIAQRELDLLQRADVVFTGGRRLYESKSQWNSNCHFYGCGVDGGHFGKAREVGTQIPAELASLPKPVLGYFGVVDERMDYELVARMADANPAWSVVVIGPVVKVDPGSMPQRPNLHWLGGRAYNELPAVCKGFDLCLMPFARNESTEYINPTKALEYMATGRAIVSTAVPDVVSNFGEVVKIANSHEEFIELCRRSVAHPDYRAISRGLKMVRENSWEAIVDKLEELIGDAVRVTRMERVIA